MTAPIPPDRPRPLADLAARWAKTLAVLLGLVTSLASVGVLSVDQAAGVTNTLTALDVTVAALIGLVTAVTGAAGAFRVARQGEQVVTPLASPRDHAGRVLVPSQYS